MRKTEHQVTIDRGWTYQRAISLRTMWIVAIACLIAGAMLPSRIWFIAVPGSHAATPSGDGNEHAFISENDVAMSRMMAEWRSSQRRRQSRFRGHDDPASSGRHRHGEGRAAFTATTKRCAGSLRKSCHAAAGDRRHAACHRPALPPTASPNSHAPCDGQCPQRYWRSPNMPPLNELKEQPDETHARRAVFATRSLVAGLCIAASGVALAGQAPGSAADPDIRSAIMIASMPPSSSPTRCRSPIPSTTSCSA